MVGALVFVLIVAAFIAAVEFVVILGYVKITDSFKSDLAHMIREEEKYASKITSLQNNILARDKRIFGVKEALLSIARGSSNPVNIAENALIEDRRILNEGQ